MLILIVALGVVPNLIFRQTNGPVRDNVTAAFAQTAPAVTQPTTAAPVGP
jgi:hypothetical protein